jgi:hypothetical protein
MSHWNYRILATHIQDSGELGKNEVRFAIHEVHYEDDVPVGCTENPVFPITFGDEGDPIENLKWQFEAMKTACEKPILNYDNFPEIYTKYYRKKKLNKITELYE